MKRNHLLLSPETEQGSANVITADFNPPVAPASPETPAAAPKAPVCTCADGAPHGHYADCPEYARIVK